MSKLASPEVSLSGLYMSRAHKLNAGVPVGRLSADKTYILWQKKSKSWQLGEKHGTVKRG